MMSAYEKQLNTKKDISVEIVEKNKKKLKTLKKKYKNYTFYSEIPIQWNGAVLILAIKPQVFKNVSAEIIIKKLKTNSVVSIMAGINTKTLKNNLKFPTHIIRAMPNKASEVMMGVTCIYSKTILTNYKKKLINKLFLPLGKCIWIKKELLMDAVTAISGSGPAYFYLYIYSLIKVAKSLGFKNNLARELVISTATGSLELVKSNANLLNLIEDVKSPGGTTEAALKILEKKDGENFINILEKAVNAAKNKSLEISKRIN